MALPWISFRHVAERDTPLIAAEPVSYSEDVPVVGSGLDFLLFGPSQDLLRTAQELNYRAAKGEADRLPQTAHVASPVGMSSQVRPCSKRPFADFARRFPSAPHPPHCLKKNETRCASH
jgi:hypothetical protein